MPLPEGREEVRKNSVIACTEGLFEVFGKALHEPLHSERFTFVRKLLLKDYGEGTPSAKISGALPSAVLGEAALGVRGDARIERVVTTSNDIE